MHEEDLTLLCGRYEGFDERILEHFASDVVSIGSPWRVIRTIIHLAVAGTAATDIVKAWACLMTARLGSR